MNIKFKSEIIQNQELVNTIVFDAKVDIEKLDDNFTSYSFIEPSNNIANIIDVSANQVKIHVGPSTLYLKLQENCFVDYQTEYGIITFVSFLETLEIEEKEIRMQYVLRKSNKELIGQYKISMSFYE